MQHVGGLIGECRSEAGDAHKHHMHIFGVVLTYAVAAQRRVAYRLGRI